MEYPHAEAKDLQLVLIVATIKHHLLSRNLVRSQLKSQQNLHH